MGDWSPFILICVLVLVLVAAIPIAFGTVLHLRENKRLFGRWFP